MSDNPWDDPETKKWMDHVRENVAPKIRDSGMTISLIPDDPKRTDIKFAVELGLSIMYDKPIIAVVAPGTQLPEHLVRVVDDIVEWDGSGDPVRNQALLEAIKRIKED
jgi:hypothetical protein